MMRRQDFQRLFGGVFIPRLETIDQHARVFAFLKRATP
jgi:hypothetical protein